uniref:Uncharacterized protein n=2 Tax=Pan TaxID=9596 RepID=A0A2I3RNT1_PANTR
MRRAMELKPELLLHEAHENVEVTRSSRRELGEAQRQIKECKRMRNCIALPKRSHTFSWTAYQKYLYWLMCFVYLLSWMTQFL